MGVQRQHSFFDFEKSAFPLLQATKGSGEHTKRAVAHSNSYSSLFLIFEHRILSGEDLVTDLLMYILYDTDDTKSQQSLLYIIK